MQRKWIWLAALAIYAVFSLWYNNLRGPLTQEEVATYIERMQTTRDNSEEDRQRIEDARAFLEADDGGQFFMINLIKLHEGNIESPDTGEELPASEILSNYTDHFMPALFKRAGHIAFGGQAAGRYIEAWGVEPDPGWTFAGIVRYRSRRDMMELATNEKFAPAHAHKIAAMASTLAFPVAPALMVFGPRIWVPVLLALIAALLHLAIPRRNAISATEHTRWISDDSN